ncbi:geranylgeranylglycerol-phosphate geranylgeranyltransferase [Chitinophagaceae bacterium LB-8]|jgi:4-hydroxybenzoate polyprenyltransferase|uniref:Geranylgeranylglycerol-phosphate geranylgeranyltransferase n=1 Tax=Paraflavisolibacter caeni TaxID=2982496 RepID=A0A9X3B914_9BACT|nr:geranylgeranylglycerol-phosphate geranylgeranyltransferase [Paraflavisolibacter caeni]MCU7551525.1 geranylgeranylglycerol-phosphate geranylgeranyltransferase [Paraflavisolibacter caeni]
MRLVAAFLRLVRWPNLVFIIITQLLFYFCIYQPLFQTQEIYQLLWLIVASVFIAAAGYIINDYFDLNIDQINKPGKNVINSIINRRWAIIWHIGLSTAGIIATAIAVSFHKWYLIIANIVVVSLLWLYSTSFKRQLLIGNIVISLLTSWTVLILFFAKVPFNAVYGNNDPNITKYFKISFLYAGFAFVISLVREAIKDIEDLKGDLRYECRTLPIVTGIRTAKVYVAVWLVVLIGALLLLQLYLLLIGWAWAVIYSILFVIVPSIILLSRLLKARTTQEFSKLSALTKLIMFTGILSMIFFRL